MDVLSADKTSTPNRSESPNTFGRQQDRLPSAMTRQPTKQKLLVVGLGMAAYGLCKRLVRSGGADAYDIVVVGDEPGPAYDRVNLSKLFSGTDPDDLLLAPESWYRENRIRVVTQRRIVAIDRQNRVARDNDGEWYPYDKLVLATGSHAWVPKIPGADSEGVFVYRTLSDLIRIKEFVRDRGARVGAVIGGGLLGLEAAKVLTELGLTASVIEMAPGLMPRQLDAAGAERLKQSVETLGVEIQLVRRTESIVSTNSGRLAIRFANSTDLQVDVLIIAAGVRPNDQLATTCDLAVGPRGGFVVSDQLCTNDPDVYAIGECASFRDHVYGLVAPCYRMADVLSDRLSGEDVTFQGADESAELKLLGVQVVTLGRAIGESPGVIPLTYQDARGYRKILIAQGRVVGASCVGPWDDLPQVRHAINRQQLLWPWQRSRFLKTGTPWASDGVIPVHDWPAESVICSCLGVTKATLLDAIGRRRDVPAVGETDAIDLADAIARETGASTACGSCRHLVCQLSGGRADPVAAPGSKVMLVASLLALLLLGVYVFASPPGFAVSVQSSWRAIDSLWRNDLPRQFTGFTLLAVTAIGMVFSLRKRIAVFQWGSYGLWRAMHGVMGTAALLALIVHTGMRLGSNLNLMLGICFLATIAMGVLAGIASSLESRTTGRRAIQIRAWRGRLARFHLWVTWPLPVLIGLHILSFYWFSD